jgi:hypothetical protein
MALRSAQIHQDPPSDALDTEIAQLANRLFVLYEEKAEVAQRASRATQLSNDSLHASEIEAELGDVRFKLSELQLVAYRRDRSKGAAPAGPSGVSTLPTYQLRPNTQRSRRSARSEYTAIKRLEAAAGLDGVRAARQRVSEYRAACRKLEVWRELSAEAVSQVYLEALEEIVRDGIEPVIDCRDDLRERREFAQYQSPHRLNWADE